MRTCPQLPSHITCTVTATLSIGEQLAWDTLCGGDGSSLLPPLVKLLIPFFTQLQSCSLLGSLLSAKEIPPYAQEPVEWFGMVMHYSRYRLKWLFHSANKCILSENTLWRIIGNHFHLTGWHSAFSTISIHLFWQLLISSVLNQCVAQVDKATAKRGFLTLSIMCLERERNPMLDVHRLQREITESQ